MRGLRVGDSVELSRDDYNGGGWVLPAVGTLTRVRGGVLAPCGHRYTWSELKTLVWFSCWMYGRSDVDCMAEAVLGELIADGTIRPGRGE